MLWAWATARTAATQTESIRKNLRKGNLLQSNVAGSMIRGLPDRIVRKMSPDPVPLLRIGQSNRVCSTFADLLFRSAGKARLLPQLHQRCPLAAFILRGFGDGGHVGMRLEEVAHPPAENAGAVAVNHAHARQPGKEGAIKVLLQLIGGLIDGAADQVYLHAHVIAICGPDGDLHAF